MNVCYCTSPVSLGRQIYDLIEVFHGTTCKPIEFKWVSDDPFWYAIEPEFLYIIE